MKKKAKTTEGDNYNDIPRCQASSITTGNIIFILPLVYEKLTWGRACHRIMYDFYLTWC